MAKITIVTDSTSAISPEIAQGLDISIVPLVVNFGQDSFKEGIDIQTDQFFQLLAGASTLPTTSQPAVGDIMKTFEKALATHDQVIAILISSGLSGTYSSAVTAANMAGGDITVLDSQITSQPMARMVIEAATMAKDGQSKEAIIQHVDQMIRTAKAYFVVDTLDHLHRGGRIGGAAALFGSLLQIKPILTVVDGKIELLEKVRTKRKALDRVFDLVKQNIDPDYLKVGVIHTQRLEEANELEQRVHAEIPGATTEIQELSPVISTHVGPGILALFFHEKMEGR